MDELANAEVPDYEPDLAFTLINSRIPASAVLANLSPEVDIIAKEDGVLSMVYSDDIYSVTADSAFTVPPFSYYLADSTEDLTIFSFLVREMHIKSGQLYVNMRHDPTGDIAIEFELTNAERFNNGQPLRIRDTMRSDGVTATFEKTYNLNNYYITPSDPNFRIRYDARKVSDNSRVILDVFYFSLENMKVYYLEGLLGSSTYEVPYNVIYFDVFERISSGYIWYDDPTLDIIIKNSFGYPLQIDFNVLEVGTKSGGDIPITSTLFDEPAIVDYPGLNEIGVRKETVYHLDKTNSNIQDALYPLIKEIRYDGLGTLNPINAFGHLTDTSKMILALDMDLPWTGWGTDITVWDQWNVDFSSYLDDFENIKFKVVTENFIPSNVDVQLYFALADGTLADGEFTGTILDSLLLDDQRTFVQAPIGTDGRVTATAKKEITASLDKTRLENILTNTEKVLIRTVVQSMDGGPQVVRIYEDYFFEVRLGIEITPNL